MNAPSGWILLRSVKPRAGQVCLVGWDVIPDMGYWIDKIGVWNGYEFEPDRPQHCQCNVELLTNVTHWQPVPDPPRRIDDERT